MGLFVKDCLMRQVERCQHDGNFARLQELGERVGIRRDVEFCQQPTRADGQEGVTFRGRDVPANGVHCGTSNAPPMTTARSITPASYSSGYFILNAATFVLGPVTISVTVSRTLPSSFNRDSTISFNASTTVAPEPCWSCHSRTVGSSDGGRCLTPSKPDVPWMDTGGGRSAFLMGWALWGNYEHTLMGISNLQFTHKPRCRGVDLGALYSVNNLLALLCV
jgi:hypothetical protein